MWIRKKWQRQRRRGVVWFIALQRGAARCIEGLLKIIQIICLCNTIILAKMCFGHASSSFKRVIFSSNIAARGQNVELWAIDFSYLIWRVIGALIQMSWGLRGKDQDSFISKMGLLPNKESYCILKFLNFTGIFPGYPGLVIPIIHIIRTTCS